MTSKKEIPENHPSESRYHIKNIFGSNYIHLILTITLSLSYLGYKNADNLKKEPRCFNVFKIDDKTYIEPTFGYGLQDYVFELEKVKIGEGSGGIDSILNRIDPSSRGKFPITRRNLTYHVNNDIGLVKQVEEGTITEICNNLGIPELELKKGYTYPFINAIKGVKNLEQLKKKSNKPIKKVKQVYTG